MMMFIGGIGAQELVLIVVILLILFGGSKLPALMKGAGKGIREFKDAMNGIGDDAPEKPAAEQEKKASSTEETEAK